MALILFLVGIVAYSFVEYATHRWLLHGPMIKSHRIHHMDPNKRVHVNIRIMILACFMVWAVAGMALMLGMFTGWILSSLFHWRLHVGNLTAPWVRKLKGYHYGHHRNPTTNYGVTNMLWDTLFHTKGLPH